jgi:hypothetical protein
MIRRKYVISAGNMPFLPKICHSQVGFVKGQEEVKYPCALNPSISSGLTS